MQDYFSFSLFDYPNFGYTDFGSRDAVEQPFGLGKR